MRHDALLLGLLALVAGEGIAASAAVTCHNGAYRTRAGDLIVISGAKEEALRYFRPDGRAGWLRGSGDDVQLVPGWRPAKEQEAAATARGTAKLGACDSSSIELSLQDGPSGRWDRIPLEISESHFRSDDLQLRGRLVAPAGDRWPLVVLVHGSESTQAINAYQWQYMLPAQGVAVFVFDKRGTGGSEGAYTQDFHVLARDAAAAVTEARRLAGARAERVGLLGGSQGGWIAPLAAKHARADFVMVAFGLMISALHEDRAQVLYDLRKKGYDETVLAHAREVADATGKIVLSGFKDGYKQLAALKKRYGKEPWFAQLRGEYTGDLLRASERDLRRDGRSKYDNLNVPWTYDPVATVSGLTIPQLWILAGEDAEAPSDETIATLRRLQGQGKAIDLVVFPNADHGILEFDQLPDGTREPRQYSTGYFDLPADWLRGRMLGRAYGNASITLREKP